jgi:uncharacterized membrane protein YgdD (TMEM256/DUF423 family)
MTRRAAPHRGVLFTAAATGLSAIALGAFGAHALRGVLEANQTREVWNTAVLYHLIHAPALLWAATAEPFLQGAIICWTVGIVLFSGSLYALALTKISALGAITPIGGLLLMAGWAIVGIRSIKS